MGGGFQGSNKDGEQGKETAVGKENTCSVSLMGEAEWFQGSSPSYGRIRVVIESAKQSAEVGPASWIEDFPLNFQVITEHSQLWYFSGIMQSLSAVLGISDLITFRLQVSG